MSSHRGLRMAQAIREVVAKAILFEMADPRVRSVTVLDVDVASDMRNATIRVSIMGTEAEQKLALKGLKHAAGFIQSRVAARLQTRFTPILAFKIDDSVKKSVEISRIIDEALEADRKPGEPEAASEAADLDDDEIEEADEEDEEADEVSDEDEDDEDLELDQDQDERDEEVPGRSPPRS